MKSVLTPEAAYLGRVARAWAAGASSPVAAGERLDSDQLVRLVAQQRAMQTLAPLLDRTLLPAGDQVQLERALEVSRRRTTMMLLELERVLQALAALGIRPVVLKGASLALTTYATPEERWFVDLDLLCEPQECEAAYAALERLGYRFAREGRARYYYEKYHFHHILISNQGVCIEVHWAVTLPSSVYRFDLDALRSRASEVELAGVALRAPHAVDQVLHGVLQSIAGGFSDLRRILDLHLLDARLDDHDRKDLCERALADHVATGLWLQYELREQILGAAMPSVIDRRCRPSAAVARVLSRLDLMLGCLDARHRHPEGTHELVHWLCTPARQRLREVRRYLLPGEELMLGVEARMQRELTLPDRLRQFGLHALVTTRLLGRVAAALVTQP